MSSFYEECVPEGIHYGYGRVSTKDQNPARQRDELLAAGVDPKYYYEEKESGKDFNRAKYNEMLSAVREGDVIFFSSLDRMGRNYEELKAQWSLITTVKKADIVILDQPLLDTRQTKGLMKTFICDMVLSLLSFTAQNERENIRKRQAGGIAHAKMIGVKFGRPAIELPESFYGLADKVLEGELTQKDASKACNMKRTTFRKYYCKYRDGEIGGDVKKE